MNAKPQVDPSAYLQNSYDKKGRFCSYWHQINEVLLFNPNSVLEIGIGNGLVSRYLRERKIDIKTLDIDERLNPDYLASVLSLPFPSKSFEIVMCCQVLEHIPYSDFSKALDEIYSVCSDHVILSLPDLSKVCHFYVKLPNIGQIKMLIPLPRLKPLKWNFDGEHYWNIGVHGYPLQRIMGDIRNTGFEIEKIYRVFEFSWHRFFVLKKV